MLLHRACYGWHPFCLCVFTIDGVHSVVGVPAVLWQVILLFLIFMLLCWHFAVDGVLFLLCFVFSSFHFTFIFDFASDFDWFSSMRREETILASISPISLQNRKRMAHPILGCFCIIFLWFLFSQEAIGCWMQSWKTLNKLWNACGTLLPSSSLQKCCWKPYELLWLSTYLLKWLHACIICMLHATPHVFCNSA